MPREPSLAQALVPIGLLMGLLALSVTLFGDESSSGPNQIALILGTAVAGLVGLRNGHRWSDLDASISRGISTSMGAILILLVVGSVIGTWILAGVVPSMRERGGGAIVNATIGGGKAAPARALPTSVTRAAGINLTKSLANELAADNIRVNAICIGLIKSEQWVRRAKSQGVDVESVYEAMGKQVPLGRVGQAEEYADLIAFLVSERGAYITGTAINLDGGAAL